MVDQVRQRGYDGLVLLGAVIYSEGDADQVAAQISDVFNLWSSLGAHLVPVLGNYDDMSHVQSIPPRST